MLARMIPLLALLLGLCPAAAAAAAANFPPINERFCDAVWTDGADRLIYACSPSVRMLTRGAAEATLLGRLPGGRRHIAGAGRGPRITLAVAGKRGAAGRWLDGRWELGHAPAPAGVDLIAAAVDRQRGCWYAGERDGLYRWSRSGWQRFAYPDKLQVTALALGPKAAPLVVSKRGQLLRLDGDSGTFSRVTLSIGAADKPAPLKDAQIVGSWFGRHSGLLYLATRRQGLRIIDLERGRAVVRLLADSWLKAMAGVGTPRGDVLVIEGSDGMSGYHKGRLYRLRGDNSFPKQMAVNLRDRQLYVADQKGIVRHLIAGLLGGEAAPLKDPAHKRRAAVKAEDDSPATGFGFIPFYWLSGHVMLGPSWTLPPAPAPRENAFTLDLEAGVRLPFGILRGRPLLLWPALGYSHNAGATAGGHLFTPGLGVSVVTAKMLLAVSVISRYLIGTAGDARAHGLRSGLRLELFMGLLTAEADHQVLWRGGEALHGVRAIFGLDMMMLLRLGTYFNLLSNPGKDSAGLLWHTWKR